MKTEALDKVPPEKNTESKNINSLFHTNQIRANG